MDKELNLAKIDRHCVNTSEYYEVEYWSREFGITPEVLKKAVTASGTRTVDDVRKQLNFLT